MCYAPRFSSFINMSFSVTVRLKTRLFGLDHPMLDLQFVCDNLETIRVNCVDRHVEVDLQCIVSLREKRAILITETDLIRHEQKDTASLIPKAAAADKPALLEKGRALRERVTQKEVELAAVEADVRSALMTIPNLTHPETPRGGEAESKIVRTWGSRQRSTSSPSSTWPSPRSTI